MSKTKCHVCHKPGCTDAPYCVPREVGQTLGLTDRLHYRRHRSSVPMVRLNTKYPCCGRRSCFHMVESIPRQTFDRQCPECGQKWDVEIRNVLDEGGKRVDVLEWTRIDQGLIR